MDAQVVISLQKAISPDNTVVKTATEELSALAGQNVHALIVALCHVLKDGGAPDVHLKISAAIYLKNLVRTRWDQAADAGCGLPTEARNTLKQSIIPLIFTTPSNVREFLLEVLAIMAASDLPFEWPELLPTLLHQYYQDFLAKQGAGGVTIEAMAIAVDCMYTSLKKYETAESSIVTLTDLKAILQIAQEPLLNMFLFSASAYRNLTHSSLGQENSFAGNGRALQGAALSRMTTSSLRIVKALHGVDLPEFFEEKLQPLITEVIQLTVLPPCAVADAAANPLEDEPTLSDEMKTACSNLMYEYVTKYSEEYMPYVIEGTKAIIALLRTCHRQSSQDTLVSAAMSCLAVTFSVIWGPECSPVGQIPDLLNIVCKDILLPNILMRADDMESLEDDPLSFVRQELEGSQRGARREAAGELVKAMMNHHESEVIVILSAAIQEMILGSKDSSTTRHTEAEKLLIREAASFLVILISVKTSTRARGVTEIYNVGQIGDFLNQELLPILMEDFSKVLQPEAALLKSTALRFVSLFRNFLPVETLQQLLPLIVQALQCSAVVVYTTAAVTLERLLTVRHSDRSPYLSFSDLKTCETLSSAVGPLMALISKNLASADNEYVMRCLWRLLAVVRTDVTIQAARLRELVMILQGAAVKAVNPIFVHYLFEAVTALSRIVAVSLKAPDQAFEVHQYITATMLTVIENEETHSFVPYCYQVLASLLETLPSASPTDAAELPAQKWTSLYSPILQGVLKKDRWTVSASNVPGVMALLNAFLRKSWLFSPILVTSIPSLLDGFHLALSHKRLPIHLTCEYLNHIIVYLETSSLKPFLSTLISILTSFIHQNTLRSKESPQALRALSSLCLLLAKADLARNNGTHLGYSEATAVCPDLVDMLIRDQARSPGGFLAFLKLFSELSQTSREMTTNNTLLAGALAMLTHPTVRADGEALKYLLSSIPHLTGLASDQQDIARTVQVEAPSVEETRKALLEAMAKEDERGIADSSASFNGLTTMAHGVGRSASVLVVSQPILKTSLHLSKSVPELQCLIASDAKLSSVFSVF